MLTIVGQSGKALDGSTRRTWSLKIRDLSLRTEVLADDSMTWTARTQDLLAGDTILPDFEQTVSLFRDGTRIFHGHVSEPKDLMHGTRVTVLGPWWWLRRTQMTQAGTSSDRPTLELPQQPVRTSIITILTRAIAKGVPMRIGTIASTLTVSKQKLSEMSFADALAEQLKYITDGVGWWDYSSGLPAFNLTRRADAIDTVYTIRQSGNELTGYEDLQPQGELVADRVELTYYNRDSAGRPQQATQAYGNNPRPGHTQVIAISGPERDTYVPREDQDFTLVQTVDANTSNNMMRQHLMQMLPEVQASRATFGGRPVATDVFLANSERLETHSNPGRSGNTIFYHQQPALLFLNPDTGGLVSRVGKNLLLRADPPEWLKLAGMERVKIMGRIYVLVATTSAASSNMNDTIESTPPPDWCKAFPWTLQQPLSRSGEPPPAWSFSTSFTQPAFYDRHRNQIWALDFEMAAVFTTASYPVLTNIVKPAGFEYLAPPANMARDLQQMQSHTPWRGTISRKGSACDGSQLLGRKFSLAGGKPAHASMGAQPRAVTYDFKAKTVTIELGAPSRHDTGSLAQRFRQSAQTNITYT